MWFPDRIRHVASIDIGPALRALESIDASAWFADEDTKKMLAGNRPTQSLFFYSMLREEYVATLLNRPIEQNDVRKMKAYDLLYDNFAYLFDKVQEYYPPGGVFLRVQIARMPPGGVIGEHRDSLLILENSHRLHIPLITTDKLKFFVDNERVVLKAGNLYELNNQLPHWVENPIDSVDRIHIIFDYLPPEYNVPESVHENFKFFIREDRSNKKPKASDIKIDMPKVVAIVALPDEKAGLCYTLQVVDFETRATEQVVDLNGLNDQWPETDIDLATWGITVYKKEVIVVGGGKLLFFNRSLKYKSAYQTPLILEACSVVGEGKYVYIVSRGTDSVVRFDTTKKDFDIVWRFFVNSDNKIAVEKIFVDDDTKIEPSSLFGLNSLIVKGKGFVLSGEHLGNLVLMENGRVESGQQVPRNISSFVNFGKGVAYTSPDMNRVAYIADYDCRVIKSSLLESNFVGHPANFSRGLCKYQKGVLISGTKPAGVALLDMKNQSVIKEVILDDDPTSAVVDVALYS